MGKWMGRSAEKEIVLVVEDEPLLRLSAVEMLEDAGFEVIEASDGLEAVKILEQRLDIHLVFSDIDMPNGMDGLRLAAMIRDRWPPIEIVLTSGKVAPDTSSLPARCLFYSKPYRPRQVIEALRRFAH